jgi:release factor glutamine methyltransferase
MENPTAEATEAPATKAPALVRAAAWRLTSSGIDTGLLDAEVLLAHVLGVRRENLLMDAGTPIDDAQMRAYERLIARRLEREPTAYITGKREFWSVDIQVTRDVLIPRPETELLVEVSLAVVAQGRFTEPVKILDLGTGSGAVAVAFATELGGAKIVATDISAAALAVAAGNAMSNGVAGRIRFIQGDLFDALDKPERFDLIVSNPPYIRRADIDGLERDVSLWEPRGALDGGVDGLDYYRRIAAQIRSYLAPHGAAVVETGAGMGAAVAAIFKQRADGAEVELHKDYAGNERAVVVRLVSRS